MIIKDRTQEMYRFARPIFWRNDDDHYLYSQGGTANIVKLANEYFILTANHCMDKKDEGYEIEDCHIPWRMTSEAFCKIGEGCNFPVNAEEGELDEIHGDIRIHKLEGPSLDDIPLEEGEYHEIPNFEMETAPLPFFLTGYPKFDQNIDYEKKELLSAGHNIQGHIESTTDDYILKFVSKDLVGVDADGFSGGLITSNIYGNARIQGLCIQGSRNKEIDFVRFIRIEIIGDMLTKAYEKLIAVN